MAKKKTAPPSLLKAAKRLLRDMEEPPESDQVALSNFHALRAAIAAHEAAPPPCVYVHVKQGLIEVGKPVGVEVEIIDFDTDGADEGELCDGHNCEVHKDHRHEVYPAKERANIA